MYLSTYFTCRYNNFIIFHRRYPYSFTFRYHVQVLPLSSWNHPFCPLIGMLILNLKKNYLVSFYFHFQSCVRLFLIPALFPYSRVDGSYFLFVLIFYSKKSFGFLSISDTFICITEHHFLFLNAFPFQFSGIILQLASPSFIILIFICNYTFL